MERGLDERLLIAIIMTGAHLSPKKWREDAFIPILKCLLMYFRQMKKNPYED